MEIKHIFLQHKLFKQRQEQDLGIVMMNQGMTVRKIII